jgi:hypothetical protein
VRFLALSFVSLAACTSTYTATFTVPGRELSPPEASCAATSGACVRVIIHDEMGSSFALDSKSLTIDGAVAQEGAFLPIASGHHTAVVDASFHFVSHCFYCYVRAYAFHVHSRHEFDVGKSITLHAIAYEKGGVTTPIEQRLDMRWLTR